MKRIVLAATMVCAELRRTRRPDFTTVTSFIKCVRLQATSSLEFATDTLPPLRTPLAMPAVSQKPDCLRAGVAVDQVRHVVVKYLRENPAIRDRPAHGLAVMAIVNAFCPNK
ncbi:hypothetical protein J2X72_003905 [Phyllobacterium sp. 1468]|uniref:Rap1a/Tai family immunity protein n=1 Tax=Phyllobacterium sp. 1468 TaxID=2817759 RepID=UPI00285E4B0E|nr:Rap1a/Tai family immunity protein [Phyllobacterium sp. 1468]MDR6635093.1 hypothetical protein [Phyllobacterium sp. 1468]